MKRARSPRRPASRVLLPDSAVSDCWSPGWNRYPGELYKRFWLALIDFMKWLAYRHAWYSEYIIRCFNGDYYPCDWTALHLFAKRTGQPARLVAEEDRKSDPVRPNVVSWTSLTGNRPMLIRVQWSRKDGCKMHALLYESGVLTHSCALSERATKPGKPLDFPVRRDDVPDASLFDRVAADCRVPVCRNLHRELIGDILVCMRRVPGAEEMLDFPRMERKMFIHSIHRTHLPENRMVSLRLDDKWDV